MKFLDLTLPKPTENLACDEALLDACEAGECDELLRFWEPLQMFVVLGYGNRTATEVNIDACQAGGIPILRRCSGGGTVLQGPGCLNYSVMLRIVESGQTHSISGTNRFVLDQNRRAFESLVKSQIDLQGQTDLSICNLKFSGNAQRRKRNFLIFHGTFLLQFDIASIGKFLLMPSQQPEYRKQRTHEDFLTNLELSPEVVKRALQTQWQATKPLHNLPASRIKELSETKYLKDEWNFRL